jgi:beta-lactamase superfamily II metal-dependent hydrolase
MLGPSKEYYESLLPLFRGTPEPLKALRDLLGQGFLGTAKKAAEGAVRWLEDRLDIDLLNDDEDGTSAENNTSTIILFSLDGDKLLFTGDAGKTALLAAADYAESQGLSLASLQFLDVPHHGSKRNLSSRALKRISASIAFISAPKDSPKHPAKKVTNALQKHGAKVFVTRGLNLLHSNPPAVRGWSAATMEQFHIHVEE